MHAQNAVIAQHQFLDAADLLRVGLASQQTVHRIPAHLVARLENDQRNDHADPAVDQPAEDLLQHHADHHRTGGDTVAEAVLGGSQQGAVIGQPSHLPVEQIQPALQQHRQDQHNAHHDGHIQPLGLQNRRDAVPEQTHCHQHDDHAHRQRAQIFHTSVAKWVILIHRLLRHAGGHQRHHAATGIRQVVHSIRRYSQRSAEDTHQKLGRRQQRVDQNAHRGAKGAVCRAHRRILPVFCMGNKTSDQPVSHGRFPPLLRGT